ncbi:acyl-CoA dehydrogenase C-terminal domain-containing protein [Paracoccus pantotrophus]|uniref:acyl-CoA dehydrogenase C-terminal domain-containing protein n=1 Tax=Paracoccus pantotrophus TaxID=82367 RepID=UPI00048B6E05|nr:acyl-CoA dehydrogenase C-terminal domain-containing protein [Paracoccus pantotrophus]
MATYTPPIDEYGFLLKHVFDFDQTMAALPVHEGTDAELVLSVLEEAGKFCTGILEPLNRPGDEEGCRLENGEVVTPRGTKEAYRAFVEAGWGALSGEPEFGGQGLPRVVQILLDEMLSSTHLSFGLFTGLTRGAAEALASHGSDELRRIYLPKLISSEWSGAMALTEASAGTDLGLLTSRAEPVGDGSFRITGTKIFISSGDHDFGGNVIHLVLARLPDAPKGVKGISLFLVPKFLVNPDGTLGERNAMAVGSLEHKMGIHAQPTCVMNYDGAIGWLVGEEGRGLNAMFTMMNAERLFVGIQGLGISEIANQKATDYAHDRRQGRSLDGTRSPVPIVEHPDVRKMLLTGRSLTDASRALAVWTAMQMDIAAHHPEVQVRAGAEDLVALLTPVIKAAFTDFGFETAVASQQVLGGHGYIREWGMEQFVRDVRIAQIYEGTNGVQAMDLVTRKITAQGGAVAARFFASIRADLTALVGNAHSRPIREATEAALARLERATAEILADQGDPAVAGAAATDYLRLFSLTACGWMWARTVGAADPEVSESQRRRVALANFFAARVLPQTIGLENMLLAGPDTLMAVDLS